MSQSSVHSSAPGCQVPPDARHSRHLASLVETSSAQNPHITSSGRHGGTWHVCPAGQAALEEHGISQDVTAPSGCARSEHDSPAEHSDSFAQSACNVADGRVAWSLPHAAMPTAINQEAMASG